MPIAAGPPPIKPTERLIAFPCHLANPVGVKRFLSENDSR